MEEREGKNYYELPKREEAFLPSQKFDRSDFEGAAYLRWVEKWDTKEIFKDAVNIVTGQVAFSLPIFDFRIDIGEHLLFLINYDSLQTGDFDTGVGWTNNFASEFITVDYQGSIFQQDAVYKLVSSLGTEILKISGQSGDIIKFKAPDKSDFTDIVYDKAEETWTLTNGVQSFIYGGSKNSNAVVWSLGWKNWRGKGTDESMMEPIADSWFLSEKRILSSNKIIFYVYESTSRNFGQRSYTSEIRLLQIKDSSSDRNLLEFEYVQKPSEEFTPKFPKDAGSGEIQFPVPLGAGHYLEKCTLRSKSYQQTIEFSYLLNNGKRLLQNIHQTFAYGKETLISFDYESESGKNLISDIRLANGLQYKYKFDAVKPAPMNANHLLTYPSTHSLKFAAGRDISIMSFVQRDFIVVRILHPKTKQFLKDLSIAVENNIMDHQVHLWNKNAILLVRTAEEIKIVLLRSIQNSWEIHEKHLTYKSDSVIHIVESFIVLLQINTGLKIIKYSEDSKSLLEQAIPESSQISRFKILNNMIVGGFGSELLKNKLAFFWEDGNKWEFKWMELDEKYGSLLKCDDFSLVNAFKIDENTKAKLHKYFCDNAFEVFQNSITIKEIKISKPSYIQYYQHVLTFNSDFKIVEHKEFLIDSTNLLDLQTSVDTGKSDKSSFFIKYRLDNERFQMAAVDFSGKIKDDLKRDLTNKNKYNDAFDQVLREFNSAYAPHFINNTLLDLSKYQLQVSQARMICGGTKLLRFTGPTISSEQMPKLADIKLGNSFILREKNNESSVLELLNINDSTLLWTLNLKQVGDIVMRFPVYIAYQENDSVRVLGFENSKFDSGNVRYFANETLLTESDYFSLLTLAASGPGVDRSNEIRIRRSDQFSKFGNEEYKIVRFESIDDEEYIQQRLERYERFGTFNNMTVNLIPAAEKKISGYIQLWQLRDQMTGEMTVKSLTYDGDDNIVRVNDDENAEKEKERQQSLDSVGIMLDASKKLILYSVSPYDDDTIGYFGFEMYETNKPSKNNFIWKYKESQVRQNEFSFTGNNVLRLEISPDASTSLFERVFIPSDQNQDYAVSAYIRCSENLSDEEASLFLKAQIGTVDGLHMFDTKSIVVDRFGDWFYVRILLDFGSFQEAWNTYKENYETSLGEHSERIKQLDGVDCKFKIQISIKATKQQIDVDHVLFHPDGFDFKTFVYDTDSGKPTAIIGSDGSIVRKFYDVNEREIAESSTRGAGKVQFQSISRTGKMFPAPPLAELGKPRPCMIAIDSEMGMHEVFDNFSFKTRWRIENNQSSLVTAPGKLMHINQADGLNHEDNVILNPNLLLHDSIAISLSVHLLSRPSSLHLRLNGVSFQLGRGADVSLTVSLKSKQITPLSERGELTIVSVKDRYIITFDSVVIFDERISGEAKLSSAFELKMTGMVLIQNFFIFPNPKITVQYQNAWGQTLQTILLKNEDTSLVQGFVYDSLGRETIKSKMTFISRSLGNQPLLKYYKDFIEVNSLEDHKMLITRGAIKGLVNSCNPTDEGFPYHRNIYDKTPFNDLAVLGAPGKEFSVSSSFALKYTFDPKISFIYNNFPSDHGFYYKVVNLPNGSIRVSVFDKFKNRVAKYVHVPGYDHILSTFEYNEGKKLTKYLPPNYHDEVDSKRKFNIFDSNILSELEIKKQELWGNHMKYDKEGRLIYKKTPDSNVIEYIFNDLNQLKFIIYFIDTEKTVKSTTCFNYYSNGKLKSTKYNSSIKDKSAITLSKEKECPAEFENFQFIQYQKQGKKFAIVYTTKNEDNFVLDSLHFDPHGNLIKQITLPVLINNKKTVEFEANVHRSYSSNKRVKVLQYPDSFSQQKLSLFHKYDSLGNLQQISLLDGKPIVTFDYNAAGQVSEENYLPSSEFQFKREYIYNSPGFLTQIRDNYLCETLTYTSGGYTDEGFGDGSVMSSKFNAVWRNDADVRQFIVDEGSLPNFQFAAFCIDELKNLGYLTREGLVKKMLIPHSEVSLPLLCRGNIELKLSQLLLRKSNQNIYGQKYSYGNRKELIQAKYFTDQTESDAVALQKTSFRTVDGCASDSDSEDIWLMLKQSKFIIGNKIHKNENQEMGKEGKSIFKLDSLINTCELACTRSYIRALKYLFAEYFANSKKLTISEFRSIGLKWHKQEINEKKSDAFEAALLNLRKVLVAKEFLTEDGEILFSALTVEFKKALEKVTRKGVRDVVGVMAKYFRHRLGYGAFDFESYDLDANGNHRHFYTGFESYQLKYQPNTNKIELVIKSSRLESENERFEMRHDSHGNVVRAEHVGIDEIKYHPVSQRTMQISMTDGRKLKFSYNYRGERVFKRLYDSAGHLTKETSYVRDEKGSVLVDKTKTWHPESKTVPFSEMKTSYIYGPRGLIAFVRNDKLFVVLTDHAGSVKLVVSNGKVVSAYDYLPYGQLLRSYEIDPDAKIRYLFTGQEYDEEVGLYNYHARLYDPSIGRFFQIDPKEEYASPYKYAGNSPVSVVDPDGQFAFILIPLITAVVGAYLGGAAANNRWAPWEWDLKSADTWADAFFGGFTGAMLPFGISSSFFLVSGWVGGGLLGTVVGASAVTGGGLAGAYLSASRKNSWDVTKWDMSSQEVYNSLFDGFSIGSTFIGAVFKMPSHFIDKYIAQYHSTLSNAAKMSWRSRYLIATYGAGLSVAYVQASIYNNNQFNPLEWDGKSANTWYGLVYGFDLGTGFGQGALELYHSYRNLKATLRALRGSKLKIAEVTLDSFATYFLVAQSQKDFNIFNADNWKNKTPESILGFITGILTARSFTNFRELYKELKLSRKIRPASPGKSFGQIEIMPLEIMEIPDLLPAEAGSPIQNKPPGSPAEVGSPIKSDPRGSLADMQPLLIKNKANSWSYKPSSEFATLLEKKSNSQTKRRRNAILRGVPALLYKNLVTLTLQGRKLLSLADLENIFGAEADDRFRKIEDKARDGIPDAGGSEPEGKESKINGDRGFAERLRARVDGSWSGHDPANWGVHFNASHESQLSPLQIASNESNPSHAGIREVTQPMQLNDTLMLSDLVLRKLTKAKPVSFQQDGKSDHMRVLASVLKITAEFEDILRDVEEWCGLDLQFNPVTLQTELSKLLTNPADIADVKKALFNSVTIDKSSPLFHDIGARLLRELESMRSLK